MEDCLKDELRKKAQTWAENETREWNKKFPLNLITNKKYDFAIKASP